MASNLEIAIGIGALILSLVVIAFIFYPIGKSGQATQDIFTIIAYVFFVIIALMSTLGFSNFFQTFEATVLCQATTAIISFFGGYSQRHHQTTPNQ